MRAVLLAAPLVLGCKIDLDHRVEDANVTGRSCKVSTSPFCVEAEMHSEFAWMNSWIFYPNCGGESCHGGPTASGKLDLSEFAAYAALMGPDGTGGVKSRLDSTRNLVVPGDPAKSYLFHMIRGVEPGEADPPTTPPPRNIGYMPMSSLLLCCQKIDAIERWITAGALNN